MVSSAISTVKPHELEAEREFIRSGKRDRHSDLLNQSARRLITGIMKDLQRLGSIWLDRGVIKG
jgi:hypothetical protein